MLSLFIHVALGILYALKTKTPFLAGLGLASTPKLLLSASGVFCTGAAARGGWVKWDRVGVPAGSGLAFPSSFSMLLDFSKVINGIERIASGCREIFRHS